MEIFVHDRVGHTSWGLYAALLSFSFLFISLADLGINSYTTQHLASQQEKLRGFLPHLLGAKIVLAGLFPPLMVGMGFIWGYRGSALWMLLFLAMIHGGSQFMQYFRANFQALQKFRLDAYASITEKTLLLLLVGGLMLGDISLERFIGARLGSIALATLIFWAILIRMYGWIRPRLDSQVLRPLLRGSIAFAVITVLYSIHDKVDQVMLERLVGERETSLYAAAYRWLDAISMYLWIVLTLFFARMARHIREPERLSQLLRLGHQVTTLPLVFVCTFGLFYGDFLINLLFQHSTPAEWTTMIRSLKWLFGALLVNGFAMIYSTLLTATGHVRFVNRLILASILINVLINFWLIPQHGAIGAAISTFISFSFAAIAYVVYILTQTPVRIPRSIGIRLLALTACMILLVGTLQALETPILWAGLISLAGYVGMTLVLRLLPQEGWAWLRARINRP